jgi:hypothetical protein
MESVRTRVLDHRDEFRRLYLPVSCTVYGQRGCREQTFHSRFADFMMCVGGIVWCPAQVRDFVSYPLKRCTAQSRMAGPYRKCSWCRQLSCGESPQVLGR